MHTEPHGISLRTKVAGWLAALFLAAVVGVGAATAVGQWTLNSFDALLEDNAACYTVQDAIKAEAKAFERYVREPSQENAQDYTAACAAAEQSLDALPFDCGVIGEERYARTWNLKQGYAGYQQQRDAFWELPETAPDYVDAMYEVMGAQNYLAEYALRLTQATLEQQNLIYKERALFLKRLPWLYAGLLAASVVLMAVVIRLLRSTVVAPLLRLVQASRSIAQNDFSGEDLPVRTSDEVGQLTRTFNQMKHAMADYLAAQTALHREEVRNLALEKDLEHTRMEVLKSQVDPHFLFNTLNVIQQTAGTETAYRTQALIMALSHLLRYSLMSNDEQVPLSREVRIVDEYYSIYHVRFGERVRMEWRISDSLDLTETMVPSFILQPIVENAFKHGICPKEEGGVVRIRVNPLREKGLLCIRVVDNGVGIQLDQLRQLRGALSQPGERWEHIGIYNVAARLRLLDRNSRFVIRSHPGRGTAVVLYLPLVENEEEFEE